MKKSWIGLLDCNNFFVSCERLFRPDLRDRPVVVLSSNDGCIVARSQEIKDMGVPMGVPYFKIKDTLDRAGTAVFSSHFALYRDISRRVFLTMRSELELIEQYSVDEAFFALQAPDEQLLVRLREKVWREVGIPVSVGLAATKTRAKYASKLAKKGSGVCLLDEAGWQSEASNLLLSELWGVGRGMGVKFLKHKLHTVADLTKASPDRVQALFGVVGARLQLELQGRMALPLEIKADPQQSIMSSRSFKKMTSDKAVLMDALAYHVRHAAADLRAAKQEAAVVRVFVYPSRYGDYVLRGGARDAILSLPSNDTFVLLRTAQNLFEQVYEPAVPYQKTGVLLTGLRPMGGQSEVLFSDEVEPIAQPIVMQTVDRINRQSGKELVYFGSRLRTDDWQAKAEVRSPSYTTRWTDLAAVSARN